MNRFKHVSRAFFVAVLFSPRLGLAQGEGGIVIVDSAPVYGRATGDSIEGTLSKTFRVAGVTTHGIAREEYRFESKGDRLHVQYHDSQGLLHTGWMRRADLETFTYDCACRKYCFPWEGVGKRAKFTKCFDDGSAQAIARLMPTPRPSEPPAPAMAAKPEPPVKAFSNEDVVALVKAGLDDGIVIAKIEQAPGAGLDVSTEALVKLKKQGVSSEVIQAMVRQAGGSRQAEDRRSGRSNPEVRDGKAASSSPSQGSSGQGKPGNPRVKTSISIDQMKADLLRVGYVSAGLAEIFFPSLSVFRDFMVHAANETSLVREYNVEMSLQRDGEPQPRLVQAKLVYTKGKEGWALANVKVQSLKGGIF